MGTINTVIIGGAVAAVLLVLGLTIYLLALTYRGGRQVQRQVQAEYGLKLPLQTAMSILDPRVHVVARLNATQVLEYDRQRQKAVVCELVG